MKPRVRFLVPVWGRTYISRFAELSLPCFLAPGNLPALAELTDLEIVILSVTANYPDFESEPAFRRLQAIAPVRFIAIDDLIVDNMYGVTLTLAYLRGVADTGADMVNRHFLFMNSDLLLADGSLRTVARRILEGRRVMLACSIRAISEVLEPKLRAMVSDHVLAVTPRRLVGMALGAMHPTQIAKIVNSDLCHSIHVNQFYWQVDAETLLSRHFLMFMLCLKPERVVTEVHAFCDYSFVPEMCPTAEPIAMEDSDEFFFLEMQARESEADFLRIGRPSLDEIAQSLSRWTTQQHRQNALKHTLIFRAGELPAATEGTRNEADEYIQRLQAKLDREPKPFRQHPYWVGSYEGFLARQAVLHGTAPPAVPAGGGNTVRRGYKIVFGQAPHVHIWHPDWLDLRAVSVLLRRHAAVAPRDILYVKPRIGHFDEALPAAAITSVVAVLAGKPCQTQSAVEGFTFALVELQRSELAHTRTLIEMLRPSMAPGAQIAVFLQVAGQLSDSTDLADELMRNIGLVAPADLSKTHFVFAGGPAKRRLHLLFNRCATLYTRKGLALLPVSLLGIALVCILAAVNNAVQARRQDLRLAVKDCSSFLLTVDV